MLTHIDYFIYSKVIEYLVYMHLYSKINLRRSIYSKFRVQLNKLKL